MAMNTDINAGRRVFALDMRNHGASPHDDDVSTESMARWAAGCVADVCVCLYVTGVLLSDVIETMAAALGETSRYSIIGHSLGTCAALAAETTAPSPVRHRRKGRDGLCADEA